MPTVEGQLLAAFPESQGEIGFGAVYSFQSDNEFQVLDEALRWAHKIDNPGFAVFREGPNTEVRVFELRADTP